jgi:hypothetical protein
LLLLRVLGQPAPAPLDYWLLLLLLLMLLLLLPWEGRQRHRLRYPTISTLLLLLLLRQRRRRQQDLLLLRHALPWQRRSLRLLVPCVPSSSNINRETASSIDTICAITPSSSSSSSGICTCLCCVCPWPQVVWHKSVCAKQLHHLPHFCVMRQPHSLVDDVFVGDL